MQRSFVRQASWRGSRSAMRHDTRLWWPGGGSVCYQGACRDYAPTHLGLRDDLVLVAEQDQEGIDVVLSRWTVRYGSVHRTSQATIRHSTTRTPRTTSPGARSISEKRAIGSPRNPSHTWRWAPLMGLQMFPRALPAPGPSARFNTKPAFAWARASATPTNTPFSIRWKTSWRCRRHPASSSAAKAPSTPGFWRRTRPRTTSGSTQTVPLARDVSRSDRALGWRGRVGDHAT